MNKLLIFPLLIGLFGCTQSIKQESSSAPMPLPYYREASFTPYWFDKGVTLPDTFHRIGDFSLTNQLGETLTQEDFTGKIYVANFFFSMCPGICPKMTDNMAIVQQAFETDDEVRLLSHSVMPRYDSVSVLKAYGDAHGVIPGKWHMVTGDRLHIYELGRKGYFAEEDLGEEKSSSDFLHTENFVLIDQRGYLRGIYNGLNKSAVNQLIEDIRRLKGSKV